MLTVLHIDPTGRERLAAASIVKSEPGPQVVGGERVITWFEEDGSSNFADEGSVYVMNDAGKTVATYHLIRGPLPTGSHQSLAA